MATRGNTGGHHNEGQKDASEGKYDPPHEHPFGIYDEKEIKDREAYRDGWRDTKDSSSSSGGCFLTTACAEYAGLGDSCTELTCLRTFRDQILSTTKIGREMIAEYYRIAPGIVARLNLSSRKADIYQRMLPMIRVVVGHVEKEKHDAAIAQYRSMVAFVKRQIGS